MSIEHFTNAEFDIELIPAGDTFRVIAAGLARGLGHRDAANMLASTPDDAKGHTLVSTRSANGVEQRRDVWYVTEPGMYRAIGQRQAARIKNPDNRAQVERFQHWIFHEVLPALRKHGRYELAGGQVHDSLPTTLTWDAASAIGRAHHGLAMNTAQFRRMLVAGGVLKANKDPRAAFEDLFWPTDTRWEIHAHALQYLVGTALITARRMQEQARNVQTLIEMDGIGRTVLEGGAR